MQATDDKAAVSDLCSKADTARMMADLQKLAGWVKLSGTPEELESLNFVRSRYEAAGFSTRIIWHDAYISLPGPARIEHDGRTLKAITHSMAMPSPREGLKGRLVYASEGEAKDFADIDASGRVALVEGIATPDVAVRAVKAGARGVVHISPHEHMHEMCISPVWGSPSATTRGELPDLVVLTVTEADGDALKAAAAKGPAEVTLHAEVGTGWRQTPILVAETAPPGAAADYPFVLFSGHHDTWHQGVMDNGSANVATIEVCRLVAAHQAKWRRGLRVCVWSGHSHGRYSSSAWYADHHFAELEARCVAHVNVDSVGAIHAELLSEAGSAGGLFDLAAAAILAESGQKLSGKRKARSADDSFPGVGIPSLFGSFSYQSPSTKKMRNALGWWWHTPHDLIDKIDPANLVRDTRILTRIVWPLLADELLPLDYTAEIAALQAEIERLRPGLAGRFPFDALAADAADLAAAYAAFRAAAQDAAAKSRALMRLSRILVPLDYTRGDRFVHDAALPLPPWSVLEPLRRLAAAARGGDDERFAEVDAIRARNRIAGMLAQARRAVASPTH
jgi:aminopeptidase YwaD